MHSRWPHTALFHQVPTQKTSCLLSVLQDTVCRCLIDIAAGMDYLHSLGVLHGAQCSLICES